MKIRVFGTMEEVTSILAGEDGTCVVEVMCNNDRHKISLDQTGKVTLSDHGDDDDEPTLSSLAGDEDESRVTCVRVRKQLREWIKAGEIIC